MEPDDYDWIPLKEYASERGKSTRTVRRWIHLGYVDAQRDGEAPHSAWLVKVIRETPARSA